MSETSEQGRAEQVESSGLLSSDPAAPSIRVDFYILSNHTVDGRLSLVCRLTDKAFNLGHKVYIHVANPAQVQRLDELLWTFKQNSFVPHAACPAAPQETAPVLLGMERTPPSVTDVLINLADEVPEFFKQYQRVIEVVDQEQQVLQSSRRRFKFYREQGLEPQTHKL